MKAEEVAVDKKNDKLNQEKKDPSQLEENWDENLIARKVKKLGKERLGTQVYENCDVFDRRLSEVMTGKKKNQPKIRTGAKQSMKKRKKNDTGIKRIRRRIPEMSSPIPC